VSRPSLTTVSRSDVGRVRTRNEDSYGEFTRPDGARLLVVADGMGGHQAGETASRVTVETVGQVFSASAEPPEGTLREALEAANARVHEMAVENPELRGMGTTAVVLLFGSDGSGFVAHVGDSRLYRYRDDVLRPLTRDHSVVAELERRGLLTAEEAAVHPRRNEIIRSVGIEPSVDIEIQSLEIRPGDRYLLCSDGLSGMVDDTEIAVILDGAEPQEAAERLIERANEHGGQDNVTVQIAAVYPPQPDAATTQGASPPARPASPSTASRRPTRSQPSADRHRRVQRRALMMVAVIVAALAAVLLIWRIQVVASGGPRSAARPPAAAE
jgi:serine/threonine protein phosphatase PrpC